MDDDAGRLHQSQGWLENRHQRQGWQGKEEIMDEQREYHVFMVANGPVDERPDRPFLDQRVVQRPIHSPTKKLIGRTGSSHCGTGWVC